jgi:hypothetical protein
VRPEHPEIQAALIARETAWIEHRTARIGVLVAMLQFGTAVVAAAGVILTALLI